MFKIIPLAFISFSMLFISLFILSIRSILSKKFSAVLSYSQKKIKNKVHFRYVDLPNGYANFVFWDGHVADFNAYQMGGSSGDSRFGRNGVDPNLIKCAFRDYRRWIGYGDVDRSKGKDGWNGDVPVFK